MYILLRLIEIKGNYVSSLYLDDPGERICYDDSLRAGQPGDQVLVVARLSESFQTGYGVKLASYAMGNWPFPEVYVPGRGVDHPTTCSVEVKERLEQ
jgi:hypothetical protein